MAEILRGKPVAEQLIFRLQERTARLKEAGIVPTAAIIRFGSNSDDLAYERSIIRNAEKIGAEMVVFELDAEAQQKEAEDLITKLSCDASVHGILVFKPLPAIIDEKRLMQLLAPDKDIDGATEMSMAALYSGNGKYHIACTAKACLEILRYYGINCSGKKAAVLGRSSVIGKPAAMLLIQEDATVTVCHSKTMDAAAVCRVAEIVIACAGKAEMVDKDYMNKDQVLIDVGINFDETGKMLGDVKYSDAERFVRAVTPVPGGVGAVTVAVLLDNLVTAAENNRK